MANRAVSFTFTTDDAQALAALKRMERGFKQLDVQVDRTKAGGEQFGSTWASSLGGLALGAGIGLAVQEFSEAEKVAAKTEAVIESTGGAAGKTAEDIADLSSELSKMAAVDDDLVQAGANVLATFTKISGTTFDEALESALDLSAAMGTDLQSSVVMIGKALNDPVKGITSMTRAGIQFTAQQKDQIRTLAESGDMLAAQAIILEELQTQFGGAAEANATSADRAKVAVGELAESAGALLAPAVEVAATALGGLGSVVEGLPQPVQQAALGVAGAAVAWDQWGDSLLKAKPALMSNVSEVSKMGTALASVGAGVGAFAAVTELLERQAATSADTADLVDDLEKLAGGSSGGVAAGIQEVADSVGDLADKIMLGTDVSAGDVFGVSGQSFQDIRAAQSDLEALDGALVELSKTKPEEARASFDAITESLRDQGVPLERVIEALPEYRDELERLDVAAADAAASTDAAAAAVPGLTGAFRDGMSVVGERADEMARLNDETERGRDLAMAAASSEFAYMDAVDSTTDAQQALLEAKQSGDPSAIERAERDLAEAMLRQAGAALANAEAQAVAEGRTLTNSDANAVLRGELDQTRETTGYWNDTLQTTADRLDYVQGASDTATRAMVDDVQAVNDKLREQANLLIWNQALFMNLAQSTVGGSVGNGGVPIVGTLGSQPTQTRPTESSTTGEGDPALRRLGVTIVAPNLTRLGTPSEVNAAMAGAGRAMARSLARS